MAFRGLFIGIDRYKSADINELSCARRDAVALDALFADTLGGTTVLLTDADATYERIAGEFAALEMCSPDDTAVIGFSGHGSETHELVAHDTDVHDLSGTAIPLDNVQDWFSRIPAKRLIFFLDCCFSGGLGAKVLSVPDRPRDLRSTDSRLTQLAGDGRVIYTASSATEPAWERMRYGHGLLTYFLIEALRGPTDLQEGGRLSLYRLLDYVTARVKAAAEQMGRTQNPTMRGQIDGALTWPVFTPGERFIQAFPELAAAKVSADLSSLGALGFPTPLIVAWGQAIPSLNPLQIEAVNDYGLLDGEHLVVSAPTSSGKTMIGELAALHQVLQRRRALFLLPLKALVADKRRHFDAVYGAFGIRTVEATGETDDISPLIRGRYDIALLTYEKFAALALTHPHLLAQAGTIVVDEAQMIADTSRGANLEFILTLIRMRRREGFEPQVVALSAVIGDTGGLESWLGGRLLRRNERPVPLAEGLLRADGSFRYLDPTTGEERVDSGVVRRQYGKNSAQDWIIPLVRRLVAEGQQVIVFRETKGEARSVANYLAAALGLGPATEAVARLPTADASHAHSDLIMDLRRGVAFHNADLQPIERRIVEEEFRRPGSGLRVIAATTTLAMGVNTPASTVIIAGLTHPGDEPYSVAEYKNLVGRAGRLGYSEKGTSYLVALNQRAEHDFWRRYVTGSPEDLVSCFLGQGTDPRSLIVRVLVGARQSAVEGITSEEIIGFLEASFGAFQAARAQAGWRWDRQDLIVALTDLESHRLVQRCAEDRYILTPIGRLAGESATEVRSIIHLVDALSNLTPDEIVDPTLITAVQVTAELDQVTFPLNKRSTQKEPQIWPTELRGQGVSRALVNRLNRAAADQHTATLRAKRAVACLLYISGRAMADIEASLTQFGGAFGGAAGPVRNVASRTSDLLPVAARVAEILHPELHLGDRVGRLVVRLTHGVPSAVTDIAREAGAELLRGDYCALAKAGLGDPAVVAEASNDALLDLLGGDRTKVAILRAAAQMVSAKRAEAARASVPVLEPYVA
ncbi:MAG: DEAD/DEAH box helicase [Amaricoccus sp.]|uniref:DEAD/DEAH box helicase n=1 Tax=Amaricoccus sp. TaxID=1872485 RepID=UPI003314C25B